MKIINNITEKLADDLRVTMKKGSRVSMAAACFSVYAFEELKVSLKTWTSCALSSLLPPFWTRSQRKPSGNFIFLG